MRRLTMRYTSRQLVLIAVSAVAVVVIALIAFLLVSTSRDRNTLAAAKASCEQKYGAGHCVEQFGTWVPEPNAVPLVTVGPEATDTPYAYTQPPATPSPTPTLDPEQQLNKDRKRIIDLYAAYSNAWKTGGSAGAEAFLSKHDYPAYQPDVPSCRGAWDKKQITRETYVPQKSSIQPDSIWTPPSGSQKGKKPDGRVYVMRVDITTYRQGTQSESQQVIHATVINSSAYLLLDCTEQ